jgi:hypothetical protein
MGTSVPSNHTNLAGTQCMLTVPNAIKRISTNLNFRNYDTSGVGLGDDALHDAILNDLECDEIESTKNNDDESTVSTTNKSGKRVVHKLGLTFFRQKLVEHFDILFNNNQIQWPSRLEGS